MACRNRLVAGNFYWVVPEPTARNAWSDDKQPARFMGFASNGATLWLCLGIDGVTSWPMRWIGDCLDVPHAGRED